LRSRDRHDFLLSAERTFHPNNFAVPIYGIGHITVRETEETSKCLLRVADDFVGSYVPDVEPSHRDPHTPVRFNRVSQLSIEAFEQDPFII
jgi:hypothetical protein